MTHRYFTAQTITDDSSGVVYDPFIDETDGRMGYRVTRTAVGDAERETYIYFNPSGSSDDGKPNVFVYMGPDNDPTLDTPQHFYDIEFPGESKPEPFCNHDPTAIDHGVCECGAVWNPATRRWDNERTAETDNSDGWLE